MFEWIHEVAVALHLVLARAPKWLMLRLGEAPPSTEANQRDAQIGPVMSITLTCVCVYMSMYEHQAGLVLRNPSNYSRKSCTLWHLAT